MRALAAEVASELNRRLIQHPGALRIHASHGYAVAALVSALVDGHAQVDIKYRESVEAVMALARGECDLAGFHLPHGTFRENCAQIYRPWLDDTRHVLIHLTRRKQGLFIPRGNPKGVVGLADLARDDVRFVNRQPGSGTRMLLDLALREIGIDPEAINGYASAELTHSAIAAFVASGMADLGFGVEPAAHHFGLAFIPVVDEDYILPATATGSARRRWPARSRCCAGRRIATPSRGSTATIRAPAARCCRSPTGWRGRPRPDAARLADHAAGPQPDSACAALAMRPRKWPVTRRGCPDRCTWRSFALRFSLSQPYLPPRRKPVPDFMKPLVNLAAVAMTAGLLSTVASVSFAQNSPGVPGGILTDQFKFNEHPQMQFAASAPSKKYQTGRRSEARRKGDLGDPNGCNLQCPQDR